jgi:FkbM family methyltransferase
MRSPACGAERFLQVKLGAWLWVVLTLAPICACRSKGSASRRFPRQVDPAALHARYGEALYSQDDEETLIRAFFDDRRHGVFLDVGAGDPVRNSTSYYLEKHLDWRGIAVDALAEYAAAYQLARPNTRFFSYFVGESTGPRRDFFASPERDFSSGTGDDPRGRSYERREVPTITLDDLLVREGVAHVDFVSMDIEGAESAALAGFSIERYQPELACVEVHSPEHGRALNEYFTLHGYREITAYRSLDPINRYFAPAP